MWHGNSYQENVNELVELGEQFAVDFRIAENTFYKKINVHPMLGEYGHKDFNTWSFLYHYFNETEGYDYSLEDMEKFGLTNIQLLDGVWEWRKHRSHLKVIRVEVESIDLEEFEFSPTFD